MIISINNAVEATNIFIGIFALALVLSLRRRSFGELFSVSVTQELKGLAILGITFSHIGYFLVSDHRFLFPISILAGVGVNLFLFLSGFGLAVSSLQKNYSVWQFYKKRLLKLLVPFWLALGIFFIADSFFLEIDYSWEYIARSFVGFFTRAELFLDINSPLWYFTLILFYYMIFPLVFFKKNPWLSAIIIYLIGDYIIRLDPRILSNVLHLYQVHILAFPIGVFVGGMIFSPNKIRDYSFDKFRSLAKRFRQTDLAIKMTNYSNNKDWRFLLFKVFKKFSELVFISGLLYIFLYTAYYSGVGDLPSVEQRISLITMTAIIIIFLVKKFNINLFYIFGLYSYEIYLLHWPILSRYDFLFGVMPAWLAVSLYLVLFLILSWILRSVSGMFFKVLRI